MLPPEETAGVWVCWPQRETTPSWGSKGMEGRWVGHHPRSHQVRVSLQRWAGRQDKGAQCLCLYVCLSLRAGKGE